MISYLKGFIKFKNEKFLILEVNNVGYQIFASRLLLEKVKIGSEAEFFTYLHLKEGGMELYGFESLEALDFFKQLNAVGGVGPKSALGVLSIGDLREIKDSIANNDLHFLTKVSGIGRRTAERIILELKNKIKSSGIKGTNRDEEEQLEEALSRLGYQNREIRKAMDKIPKEIKGLGEKIKEALKILSK
ncbi:MAG: Holliday junction DNA helicase subunit RuvA [Parcubacteria group bacterium Athens1014_10]|nr:MAG: Holliday junction DNA helicase subunit RuvA [Parcubacteria group bacterium Athens1014_10]TSD05885.1 MAG: Holliday junction DNA helicase subunit RuvA [Parcubacteria group bacterium Athens0714_12]